MNQNSLQNHKVVSSAEWVAARKELLAREKQLTRERDAISALRRDLPWVRVEKEYRFEGPNGPITLAGLFEDRNQLIVYHFMFGPEWLEGCPSCSFAMDHTDGTLAHLWQRDVSFAAISRAPYSKIDAFKKRMGWRFPWVSSHGNDFNWDYHVSFTPEEIAEGSGVYNFEQRGFPSQEGPGFSVFYKDTEGVVFHTYSTFARGGEPMMGTYQLLDLVPKGRDEDGLAFSMSWIRHHDRYDSGRLADAERPYWPTSAAG